MRKSIVLTLILTVSLAACAPTRWNGVSTPVEITARVGTVIAETIEPPGTEVSFPTPEPPTAIPTLPSSGLSPTELKYRVLDQFPDFFYCDPDYYPVAREDELPLAQRSFPELQADREEFPAILNRNGLDGLTHFTDEQKLLIYRDHKKLAAIHFERIGDKYQFQIQTGSEEQQGFIVKGTIDGNGAIDVLQRDPAFVTCPICLAAGTRIDTPRGWAAVEDLRVGDPVWTVNESGERIEGIVTKTAHVPTPANHRMIRLLLSDGRELWASPRHPTADGRRVGDLVVGDLLDGARVTFVERVPYGGIAAYDILPSGGTGFYWANDILMGSTLTNE